MRILSVFSFFKTTSTSKLKKYSQSLSFRHKSLRGREDTCETKEQGQQIMWYVNYLMAKYSQATLIETLTIQKMD